MIQIDDAGSGSFVGGTCIGFYRPEANEYYFEIIPVELYSLENFKKKLYLDYVVEITTRAFEILSVMPHETIEICRGYMFERLKSYLSKAGFCWYVTQITGKIQEVVEKNFELYTISLGVPSDYIKFTKYPFHFHKLLKWIYSDFDNRIIHCKVGWPSWQNIKDISPAISYETLDSYNFICLRCGKRIKKGTKVKKLILDKSKNGSVYLHIKCVAQKAH